MAASGADLRDILALPPSSNPAAPRKVPKAPKPDGISRELYSLIGDHAPSLAAVQRAKPKLKQKPDLGRGKVRWWVTTTIFPYALIKWYAGSGVHFRTVRGRTDYDWDIGKR
jgi:hypothetical protein